VFCAIVSDNADFTIWTIDEVPDFLGGQFEDFVLGIHVWMCVWVVCVALLSGDRITQAYKNATTFFDFFWMPLELVFIRLCGLHLQKHLGANLTEMMNRRLVDLRKMGMGNLMYNALFKRPCPAFMSGMNHDLTRLVVARTIVHNAFGFASIAKSN
jgi:hypothetical protein